MKKLFLSFSFIFIFLIFGSPVNSCFAQKKAGKTQPKAGHEIIFNIKGSQDKLVYLVIHYKERLILKDSAAPETGKPGRFVFRDTNRYDDGMYSIVSEKKKLYLNFIIDRNQFFSYNLDTTGDVKHFSVINSPENEEMLRFQRKTTSSQIMAGKWAEKRSSFDTAGQKDSADFYQQKLIALNDTMLKFIDDLIDRHPDFLFSKMQKSYKNIDVPEFKKPDSTIDKEAQMYYYTVHYWDNVDLTDHRFIFLPSFEPKLKDYFTKLLYYQESDTINKYVDMILAKAAPDTLMYRYLVDWISYQFETSKVIGHDAVFVHIAKTNQLAGKCYWLDEDVIAKYRKVIGRREPLLIGKIAPELIIPDTSLSENVLQWKSSYNIDKPYTILWFVDPDCPTCKKETNNLRTLYDSLQRIGKRNFEVYSVGNDSDVARWVKYVRDNKYPWICVGGNKGNIDYLEYFNIYETGNPTMFILNSKHEIILNKRIDMFQIPQFLNEYEKIQARKQQNMPQDTPPKQARKQQNIPQDTPPKTF